MLRQLAREASGQAMLEYVVVGAVAVIAIAALGTLWRYCAQGGLPDLIGEFASHSLATPGGLIDVFLY